MQLRRGRRKSSGYKENKVSAISDEAAMGDGNVKSGEE